MNIPENLILKQMTVGPMGNFQYFIGDKDTKEIAVVDPAWDVDFLVKTADEEGYSIVAVFLTHGHYDHADGVGELVAAKDVPVYISKYESKMYSPDCRNLKTTEDGEIIKIGNVEIKCIHAPGHTPGCQCYLSGNLLTTGDVLFVGGCGRCDLPGGDAEVMYNTLYNVLTKLPDDTII